MRPKTWDKVKTNWDEMKASAGEHWAEFTPQEMEEIGGQHQALVEALQQKYNIDEREANHRIDIWVELNTED